VTSILQVTWQWSGFQGAPGYTNLFFDAAGGTSADALAAVEKSQVFFSGLTPQLPDDVHLSVDGAVRLISDIDGELIDIYTVSGFTELVGGQPGNYAAPVGAVVHWLTHTVNGTRRMTGTTFIVPCSSAVFEPNGSLAPSTVLTIGTAAQSFLDEPGPQFGVWGRPKYAKPATTPPTIVRNGKWGPVVSQRVSDMAAVLTSRRD